MKSAADKTVSNYVFLAAESDEGKKLITERNLDIGKSAHLIDGDKILSRSDMALEVIGDMRFIGPALATLLRNIPQRRRDSMHEWLVRHRIR
jgi:predicted DCC family thiol-disulfide oxidoreductase YuxK